MKICFRNIFFIIGITVLAILSDSRTGSNAVNQAEHLFKESVRHYNAGEYAQAAVILEKIVDLGHYGPNIFFNLGNCYYRTGRIGKSIFNYHRALRYVPRNEIINNNLSAAVSRIKQHQSVTYNHPLGKYFKVIIGRISLNELQLLLILSFYGIVVFIIAGMFFTDKKNILYFSAVCLVIFFILNLAGLRKKAHDTNNICFINSEIVYARTAPFDDAETLFPLYEGMTCHILYSMGQWHRVQNLDKRTGWLTEKEILRE